MSLPAKIHYFTVVGDTIICLELGGFPRKGPCPQMTFRNVRLFLRRPCISSLPYRANCLASAHGHLLVVFVASSFCLALRANSESLLFPILPARLLQPPSSTCGLALNTLAWSFCDFLLRSHLYPTLSLRNRASMHFSGNRRLPKYLA